MPAEPAADPQAASGAKLAGAKLELAALVAGSALFAAVLAPMLRQPLWLDETATWWQIQGGFGEIAGRSRVWPTQSAAYAYVARAALDLLPGRELALRLPSVGAATLAFFLFHRLVRRLAGATAAAAATLALLAIPQLLETAAQARPYALGLAALVASWLGLTGWAETGRRRDLALWALATAAVPWFHFTLGLGVAAQLPLALRAWRRSAAGPRRDALVAAVAAALLVAPTLPQLARIAGAGVELGFAGHPDFNGALRVLVPAGLALALLAGGLADGGARRQRPASAERAVDFATLWLLPAAVALAASFGLGFHLFFPRYLLPSFLGVAACAGLWTTGLGRRGSRVVLVLLALLVPWTARSEIWPLLDTSDWRAASRRIRSESPRPGEPMLSITPYVESRSPAHLQDLGPGGMLMSMYAAYPVPALVHGLPSVCDRLGWQRLEALWRELDLGARPRVLLLRRGGDGYAECVAELAPRHRQALLAGWGRLELVAIERYPN